MTPDPEHVREIVESTGFFSPAETAVAVELVEERLQRGLESGYLFLFAERGDAMLGYSCYGPIAGTRSSFDLYWIAVHHDFRTQGLGSWLLRETETLIRDQGGTRIYVETSSREQYVPTRRFYERHGYFREALLKDFYAPGDGKVVYVKVLPE
jgi:D-alanine-D-alanine ligase